MLTRTGCPETTPAQNHPCEWKSIELVMYLLALLECCYWNTCKFVFTITGSRIPGLVLVSMWMHPYSVKLCKLNNSVESCLRRIMFMLVTWVKLSSVSIKRIPLTCLCTKHPHLTVTHFIQTYYLAVVFLPCRVPPVTARTSDSANWHIVCVRNFCIVLLYCIVLFDRWLINLENTKWLQYISGLLKATLIVVNAIDKDRKPVLVHCSDGWDRTPQIVALAELLLDPYYRTVEVRLCSCFRYKYTVSRPRRDPDQTPQNEKCDLALSPDVEWLGLAIGLELPGLVLGWSLFF